MYRISVVYVCVAIETDSALISVGLRGDLINRTSLNI